MRYSIGEPSPQVRLSGGARQFNSISVLNIADNSMTVGKVSGNDADRLTAVGAATVDVPAGTTLSLPAVGGTVGLTKTGDGTLTFYRGRDWSGGTYILGGVFQSPPPAATVYLLDTSGSADAELYYRGINSNWNVSYPIIVQSGSTGAATFHNAPTTGSAYSPTLASPLTLGSDLTILLNGKDQVMTISGAASGSGALTLDVQFNNSGIVLSGDHSARTGATSFISGNGRTGLTAQLDGTLGNANIAITGNYTAAGTGTIVCNIVNNVADQIVLSGAATLDVSGISLSPNVVLSNNGEYVIASPAAAVTGTFADTAGFAVDYDGTVTNPNAVVLTVSLACTPCEDYIQPVLDAICNTVFASSVASWKSTVETIINDTVVGPICADELNQAVTEPECEADILSQFVNDATCQFLQSVIGQ